MRTAPHLKRFAAVRAGLLLAFVLFALLAPAQLGGRISYVTTSGVSMRPKIHAGDLALVAHSSSYRVGDVAAYRSSSLDGTVVLHRIVAIHGDRYVFKGDNNDFVDPDTPTRERLVGKLWLRIPGAGGILRSLLTPGRMAFLTALAVLLVGGGVHERRRRRRREGGPSRPLLARLPLPAVGSASAEALLQPALGLLVVAALLCAVSFSRPIERPASRDVGYTQSGAFSYSAASSDPGVYAGGRARTGDPVFTRLSDEVDLSFAYRFASTAPARVSGSADLAATLRDSTGWKRALELQDWRRFDGGRIALHGTLSLRDLQATIAQLDRSTGVTHGAITIEITPRVAVQGTVAGAALRDTFKPVLTFVLDSNQLRLSTRIGPAGAGDDGTRPSEPGSVKLPATAPNVLSLGRIDARVSVVRGLGLALLALALGALAVVAAVRRSGADYEEAALIAARYRSLLVPVASLDRRAYPQIVEVASVEALARVAAGYDRMILHEESPQGHAYFVIDDGVVHAYRIGDVPLQPEAPPPAPPPPEIQPAKGHLGIVRSAS